MLSSLFASPPLIIIILGFIASHLIDLIAMKFLFLKCQYQVHEDNEGNTFKISEQIVYEPHPPSTNIRKGRDVRWVVFVQIDCEVYS
jgi:hypothetical protein